MDSYRMFFLNNNFLVLDGRFNIHTISDQGLQCLDFLHMHIKFPLRNKK